MLICKFKQILIQPLLGHGLWSKLQAAASGSFHHNHFKAQTLRVFCLFSLLKSQGCLSGTGLDFSAASAVVFVELPQEVALVRQAEDRAHRHGQKLSVNVYFLVAKGTSDERRCCTIASSSLHVHCQARCAGTGCNCFGSLGASACMCVVKLKVLAISCTECDSLWGFWCLSSAESAPLLVAVCKCTVKHTVLAQSILHRMRLLVHTVVSASVLPQPCLRLKHCPTSLLCKNVKRAVQ